MQVGTSIADILSGYTEQSDRQPTRAKSTGAIFAEQLNANVQAQVDEIKRRHPSLAAPMSTSDESATPTSSIPESANAIWARVLAQSHSGPAGIGDALMKSLSEAADKRWEERQSGNSGSLFDF